MGRGGGGWGGRRSTRLPVAPRLTATEMSVYGAAAPPDKPSDGLFTPAGPEEPILMGGGQGRGGQI